MPFMISNGVIKNRPDLMTTQEEADTILIHQVSVMGPGKAVVNCDNTDVFIFSCILLALATSKHMFSCNRLELNQIM